MTAVAAFVGLLVGTAIGYWKVTTVVDAAVSHHHRMLAWHYQSIREAVDRVAPNLVDRRDAELVNILLGQIEETPAPDEPTIVELIR